MTGQILPFDSSTHKVADALLPWFVNGTLEGDELALVQQHVRECSQCQREVEWLRDLHAACAAAEQLPGAAKGARQLRSKLDAPRPAIGNPARLRSGWRPSPQWALGALLAACVGIAAVWMAAGESPAEYRTLGAREFAIDANGSVVVVFDPATTELDLRRILRAAGARIVDGPTQANAYVLSIPSDALDRAVQALRSERSVILAERLAPGSRR